MARTKKLQTGKRKYTTLSKERKPSGIRGEKKSARTGAQPIQSVSAMPDENQDFAINKIGEDIQFLSKEVAELHAEIAASREALASAMAAAGQGDAQRGESAHVGSPKKGKVNKLKAFVSSLFNRFPA